VSLVQSRREAMNMSQNELARRSGVSQSIISDIEKNKTKNPRVNTLHAIAKVLGFTLEEYFKTQKEVV